MALVEGWQEREGGTDCAYVQFNDPGVSSAYPIPVKPTHHLQCGENRGQVPSKIWGIIKLDTIVQAEDARDTSAMYTISIS